MQLSQNQKTFFGFFAAFTQSTKNLEYFEQKDQPRMWFHSEVKDCKKRSYLNA